MGLPVRNFTINIKRTSQMVIIQFSELETLMDVNMNGRRVYEDSDMEIMRSDYEVRCK